jgi:hypothetical protein
MSLSFTLFSLYLFTNCFICLPYNNQSSSFFLDVSKDHSAFFCRVKQSKNSARPWRWRHYDPSKRKKPYDKVSHRRRPVRSTAQAKFWTRYYLNTSQISCHRANMLRCRWHFEFTCLDVLLIIFCVYTFLWKVFSYFCVDNERVIWVVKLKTFVVDAFSRLKQRETYKQSLWLSR